MSSNNFTYKVTGRGTFPLDMLRYDRASPESSEGADRIEDTFHNPGETATVSVVGPTPTDARWKSFGWVVTEKQRAR